MSRMTSKLRRSLELQVAAANRRADKADAEANDQREQRRLAEAGLAKSRRDAPLQIHISGMERPFGQTIAIQVAFRPEMFRASLFGCGPVNLQRAATEVCRDVERMLHPALVNAFLGKDCGG